MKFLAVALLVSCARTASVPIAELVETPPIETTLDASELRNAADVWPEMIDAARTDIVLAQFYASNERGSRLEPVVTALEVAAARGVRVRFLTDQSFTTTYPETLERMRRANIAVRALDLSPGVLHAKFFVVDGREAFLGSQNFDWRALEHNLELGLRTRDRGVIDRLLAIFGADWERAGGKPAPAPTSFAASTPAFELVASPRDALPVGVAWDLPRLVQLVMDAQRHIRVQLLTYEASAWDKLDRPLRDAAARGVRVELLVADWATRAKTLPSLQGLARAGVDVRFSTIPAWSGGFIPYARVQHAKLLVVDGAYAWLGTSNWEEDYFVASRNVGVITTDASLVRGILAFSERLWTSRYATRLDPDATYTAPRIE